MLPFSLTITVKTRSNSEHATPVQSPCQRVRIHKKAPVAKDRGIGGPILSASSYLMKSPPVQRPDDEGQASVEAFIRGDVER